MKRGLKPNVFVTSAGEPIASLLRRSCDQLEFMSSFWP